MNNRMRKLMGCLFLAGLLGCAGTATLAEEANSKTQMTAQIDGSSPSPIAYLSTPCPVTLPNGNTPPGEKPAVGDHGNGALWTSLWSEGTIRAKPNYVLSDGSIDMKFGWWRSVIGKLSIEGRRLDAPASPLGAEIRNDLRAGFVATAVIFPTEGCWEVIGRVGDHTLTFVTLVVKVGAEG